MCGRYTVRHPQRLDLSLLGIDDLPPMTPRFNIAPGQNVLVVREVAGERTAGWARWGLIPSWAKDPAIGDRLANARGETLAEKPSFRSAWKARRTLMPADGLYEWQKVPGTTRKQPWFISLVDDEPFALGALWESWRAPDGTNVTSCCVITTEPNHVMRPIHERMPVIVPAASWSAWLDGDATAAPPTELLRPFASGPMRAWPVSTMVNAPSRDDPRMVEPLLDG